MVASQAERAFPNTQFYRVPLNGETHRLGLVDASPCVHCGGAVIPYGLLGLDVRAGQVYHGTCYLAMRAVR